MRADIHDGPEHMLQSEAGYIDARPLTPARQNLLQRTAGPYMWVKSAVLGVARSLPVYPDQRTSSDRSGWSGSCQNRNWPVSSAGFSFLRNLGCLAPRFCLEESGPTKPTISAWSFCDHSLIHPP